MTTTEPLGTFPDRHTFRLELTYPHPPSRVWQAITDPEQLRVWFLPMELDLRLGGRVALTWYGQPEGVPPAEATITQLEPERVLAYRFAAGPWEWPPSTLRFELTPEGDGCRLVFTQRMAPDFLPTWRDMARLHIAGPGTHNPGACAGWQGMFQEGLARVLTGRMEGVTGPEDQARMAARTAAYEPLIRRLATAPGD